MGENLELIGDWPIEPTFLSIRKEVPDWNSSSPNRDGLFSTSELRGFLFDVSYECWDNADDMREGNTFSLFQLVPRKEIFEAEYQKNAVLYRNNVRNAQGVECCRHFAFCLQE